MVDFEAKGDGIEHSKEFYIFYEISLRLLDLNNYQDSISKSLRILKDNMKFKKCEIHILQEDELKLFASSDQDVDNQQKEFKEARILAQKSQERIIVDNHYNDMVFFDKSKSIDYDSIIYMAIPLLHKGEVIGVFSVSFYGVNEESLSPKIAFLEYISTLYRYAIFSNTQKDYKVNRFKELKYYYEKEFDSGYYDMKTSVFVSDEMNTLKNNIVKIAPNDIRVLIQGEIGTEKTSIAIMIHRLSHRQSKPFVILKANLLSEEELELELFGSKKPFNKIYQEFSVGKLELASGGSLIIEDIDKLPIHIQKKLVEILVYSEYKNHQSLISKYNVRIIGTTSVDLEKCVNNGTFYGELYTLLNLVTIDVPPLRDRGDDIGFFITTMINKFNNMYLKSVIFDDEALLYLKAYPYIGNIKELECSIEKLVYSSCNDMVSKNDIILIAGMVSTKETKKEYNELLISNKTLDELEKEAIIAALEKTNYNQTESAKRLGITLRQIGYKIKKYNLI